MTQEHEKKPQGGAPEDGDTLHDHERVDALMPWIARGELEHADSELIDEELAKSPAFQAKLAQESELAGVMKDIAAEEEAQSDEDADAAWTKFKARLPETTRSVPEGAPPQAQPLPRTRASSSARTSAWRRFRLPQTNVGWLATAQTAVLAALAFLFIPGQLVEEEGDYRMLSSDGASAALPVGNAVIMLDPATDLATLQQTLDEAGARIVDGPMANGGYVIALDEADVQTGLETLRASEAVVLAEPLSGEAQP
ncbi:MAG: hypothetical protein AAF251_12800 [Pseudomonadota bacterium]